MGTKYLIFSDTHLDTRFDKAKFEFLQRIITNSDKVIINGDFWDIWYTDLTGFLNSEWKKLFPLLLKKDCVYVYGDHDSPDFNDQRVRQFCKKAVNDQELTVGKNSFKIYHGHQLVGGKRPKLMEKYMTAVGNARGTKLGSLYYKFLARIENIGYKILGEKIMSRIKVRKDENEILKKHRENEFNSSWLITGDSHSQEIDKERKYINTGCIRFGTGSYVIIEGDKIELKTEKY